MDKLMLLAASTIKGIAQAGDEFCPAEHGLGEGDVAELLACGAAQVVPGAPAAPEPPAAPAKTTKTTKALRAGA